MVLFLSERACFFVREFVREGVVFVRDGMFFVRKSVRDGVVFV